MQEEQWNKILELCNKLSKVTYENLTKIIRLDQTGSSSAAQKLDDSFQNDVDAWMGGGTCFSMTWHLYQAFIDMGLHPRLVMGHKRKERNIHCALVLPDDTPGIPPVPPASLSHVIPSSSSVIPSTSSVIPASEPGSLPTLSSQVAHVSSRAPTRDLLSLVPATSSVIPSSSSVIPATEPGSPGHIEGLRPPASHNEYLFDPGYLIFDPLPIPLPPPFGSGSAFFPLVPNCVRLDRPDNDSMSLWTGGAGAPMKLRFDYPLAGVSVDEFKHHWNESFYREMMTYPVLNRLDREKGIQYYYQKGNLVIRDANGSRMEKIEAVNRVETLSKIFGLKPELIDRALGILDK